MIGAALSILRRLLGRVPRRVKQSAGVVVVGAFVLGGLLDRLQDARAREAAAAARVERLEAELAARAEAAAVQRAHAERLARLAADRAARIRDLEALGGADAPLSPRLSSGARRLWDGAAD